MMEEDGFSVPGFQVGHCTHASGATGCTVVLAERPALAVADVRGGAPGTRELALLAEGRAVQRVNGVLLTGGSAFGLDAASGVVRWLWERGQGFPTASIPVPIVAGAVIYDLRGTEPVWPGAEAGYAAAASAEPAGWRSGKFGAGAGATVAKLLGASNARPSGLGAALVALDGGFVAALIALNAVGEIVDPATGSVVAGLRNGARSEKAILAQTVEANEGENTTIGVIATNLPADRNALVRMTIAGHDGLARAIRPAHTLFDGDTLFALTSEEGRADSQWILRLSTVATLAVEQAVLNAARSASADSD